jgi:C-terminal processing protease CtpA/Prc
MNAMRYTTTPYRLKWIQIALAAAWLASCATVPRPNQAQQPPAEYLSNALDWIETHSVKSGSVDWDAIHAEALALAPDPTTTAETYPVLEKVIERIADPVTWLSDPVEARLQSHFGLGAILPEAVIVEVQPGGPADEAGLRVGDLIETVNGMPAQAQHHTAWVDFGVGETVALTVRRAGQAQPLAVSLARQAVSAQATPTGRRYAQDTAGMGYLILPSETGAGWRYPTLAQQVLRQADASAVCGWMIDTRRIAGGNLWSYLAAVGPILGEGEVGGFAYGDGTRETWAYHGGKVYWNENERGESIVEGPIFQPKRPALPVALLTSRATVGAGELLLVAFAGRPGVRRFGEATAGAPFLQFHTLLSDGAWLTVSGAQGVDRTGQVYAGPIAPDEQVRTDWSAFGAEADPVIRAALAWLLDQPECAQG